jgi:transcriptional regulator with XRE-family HTH domain
MDGVTAFGTWLKQQRRALDLRQEELADLVGCSLITIQKVEAGERRPSRQIAELLADQLQVPPDERAAFIKFARQPLSAAMQALHNNSIGRAPWRRLYSHLTNLPVEPAPLIGRQQEVREITELLQRATVRLVTLVGLPGVGKTSLSIEVATGLLDKAQPGLQGANSKDKSARKSALPRRRAL